MIMEEIKLTQFSHSSGCGCKIAPDVLEKILRGSHKQNTDKRLLVGNETNDDAAVYDLGNGQALISTVDFFMPIVDDAFLFGKIAAANALSDVYAMGGKPLFATAVLGWPVNKLPAELASKVLDGARETCAQAGIVIAGGHSIDAPEPMFGLSVNGIQNIHELKKNSGCKPGNLLYLTKKIGVGVLATALKRGAISPEHKTILEDQLCCLNCIGEKAGRLNYVTAMTDVTGFGLLGHLTEMAEGAGVSIELDYSSVPLIEGITDYTSKMIVPDNLYRNWNTYEKKVFQIGAESFFTLNDPQTNGGLIISIDSEHKEKFKHFLIENSLSEFAEPFALVKEKKEFSIYITNEK
jgi:selenide,water dikinase